MPKIAREHNTPVKHETPVVVYMWIAGLAILFYTAARIVLGAYPHPYHWAAMLAGGVLGLPIGWLWYRWRGDVVK